MNTASALASQEKSDWKIPLLCFLAILCDGFDTTSIGFIVPTLAQQWQLAPSAFTPAFVATSLGAVIGYMISGTIAARVGRRRLILGAVLLFGLGSFATALVTNVSQLSWLRLLVGVGLGAAIPGCVSLSVDCVAPRRREMMSVAVTSGLALGATLAGVMGGKLIAQFGWPSVFIVGGVLPLLLWPLLWWYLPQEPEAAAQSEAKAKASGAVQLLFEAPLKHASVLLWIFSFFVFTATYALTFWTPTLLQSFGFAIAEVPLGSVAFGMGGFCAGLALIPLSAWVGIRRVLIVTTLLAIVLIAALGTVPMTRTAVLLSLGMLGGCLIAGTIGQTGLAVAMYPPHLRTSGVGWSAALGRIGSIVGPAVAGALLTLELAPRDVVLALGLPLVAAFAGIVVLTVLSRAPGKGR